jgi:YggT family protein
MTNSGTTQSQTTQKEPEQERRVFTFKITQLVWLLFGVLEALILLRIGLKLLGANAANPIAVFIYGITGIFLSPFAGLTGTPAADGKVLEISSLIAVVVYALIAWALAGILWIIFYRPRGNVVTQTTTSDHHSNT